MNFCAWQRKNPLATIPSSEVLRLPRACSILDPNVVSYLFLYPSRSNRATPYFRIRMPMIMFPTSFYQMWYTSVVEYCIVELPPRCTAVEFESLIQICIPIGMGFAKVIEVCRGSKESHVYRACDIMLPTQIVHMVPTSTSRTVTPPAIFAVFVKGVEKGGGGR